MYKWHLLLLIPALSTSLHAQTTVQPVQFRSSVKQTALLELYTSEGCSSCPPADAWLTGLKNSPGLWKDYVPVAWHVDYWDSLGWRDPWSNDEFSDRQRAYAAAWHSESIYTPALVLNGKEWQPWLRPKDGPPASNIETGVLTVNSSDQRHWQVQFLPVAHDNTHFQVYAALLACGLGSDVKAGENNRRHLNHDFVVLSLVDQYLPGHTNEFQGKLELDASGKIQGRQTAMAFWVTHVNDLQPVQAVGGWLVKPSTN
jgi:hypothetical protein